MLEKWDGGNNKDQMPAIYIFKSPLDLRIHTKRPQLHSPPTALLKSGEWLIWETGEILLHS